MDHVKRGEVAEGGGGEDAVAVVQRVEVHHAQVQQLRHRRGQRSGRLLTSSPLRCVSGSGVSYLCDLDVRFLGELRHQEVLSVLLSLDLSVQLQPRDWRLRTQIPVQRLQRETERTGPREDGRTLDRRSAQDQQTVQESE